ncbi:MAG: TIGR04255 family protein [Gemmatimonas sp.]|nr:TIGR04255 family protein [Gemmatimonas sp.]
MSVPEQMTRRTYGNPPVHEAILSLRFKREIPEKLLESAPEYLPLEVYGIPSRQNELTVQAAVGQGRSGFQADAKFGGWEFSADGRRWVTRVSRSDLSFHALRPGGWPYEGYPGWEEIRGRYVRLLSDARELFADQEIRRVGLRYVNRIAVPATDDINKWFAVTPAWPGILDSQEMRTFTYHAAFVSVQNHEHLSATVRLGNANVEESLPADLVGLILDVDIFNYRVDAAPSLGRAVDWFDEAHSVENQVFESCITDDLRSRFE